MKRIVILIVLIGAVAVAGGGDYALWELLKDGGMNEAKIDTVLSLKRSLKDVMIVDTTGEDHYIIPPGDLAFFDLGAKYLLVIHIKDTIVVTKYPIGVSHKKKSRGP